MTSASSVVRGGRLGGLRGPALVGAAGLATAVLLSLRDPHGAGTYGSCPFLALTGLPCPGCGGLRAVNDLVRGDIAAAVSSNALAVSVVLGFVIAWTLWLVRRVRGRHEASMIDWTALTTRGGLTVLAVVVIFGIVRVTPWGAWLAP